MDNQDKMKPDPYIASLFLLGGGRITRGLERVKLARELSKRSTGRTLYVLDEPSVGLHAADVHKLIEVLQRLVEGGNTVLIIEHNLDIIKVADHLIDLGPEGGDRGGEIVVEGTPEEVCELDDSYTGQYLRPFICDKDVVFTPG